MSRRDDYIDLRTAHSLAALLDLEPESYDEGDPLPLMWHLCYFLEHPAQSDIGPDGHSTTGMQTPSGTRRMFAGGRVRHQPGLRIGDHAAVTTSLTRDEVRRGRSGALRFVTHRSEITVGRQVVMVDERDLVYIPAESPRSSGSTTGERSAARPAQVSHRRLDVDPTILFRFSALTYNAHRIHYDREYARDVEHYPGLVVHGPLQALLMAELGRRHRPAAWTGFAYRLISPLFEGEGMHLTAATEGDTVTTTAASDDGQLTGTGILEP